MDNSHDVPKSVRPLNRQEIRGTWAPVLLPVDATDRIDFVRLGNELDYLVTSGVDGIYTNGTVGEFYDQSEEEFDLIHMLVAERSERAGIPFQIGVSHMSAHVSMSRLERAIQFNPAAVQVILPDWFPVSDDEAVAFLRRMAEAAEPVGLVLYNPPHAKRVLDPAAIGKISRAVPQLIGIKTTAGDDAWYAAMRYHAPCFSLFVEGHRLATGMQKGAAGSYSNVACLQPSGAKRWNILMGTNFEAALDIECRLQRFLREYIVPFRTEHGYSNQALDKLMAVVGAWSEIGTRLRWPYQGIDESEAIRLRPIARRLLPELFTNW